MASSFWMPSRGRNGCAARKKNAHAAMAKRAGRRGSFKLMAIRDVGSTGMLAFRSQRRPAGPLIRSDYETCSGGGRRQDGLRGVRRPRPALFGSRGRREVPARRRRPAGAGRVLLPGKFRRPLFRRAESSGALHLDVARNPRRALDACRGGLRLRRIGVLPRLGRSRRGHSRRGHGGGRRKNDVAADAPRQRDPGGGRRLFRRDARRQYLRLAVRHDRPPSHARSTARAASTWPPSP